MARSPSRSTAAASPPISTYCSAVRTSSRRRSHTSARAADASGNVPSWPATSATRSSTSSGSTVQPVRRAGWVAIRRSSSSVGGPTSTWASSTSSTRCRDWASVPYWSARTTSTTWTSSAASSTRSSSRAAKASADAAGRDLLELVDDQQLRSGLVDAVDRRPARRAGRCPGTITCDRHGAVPGRRPLRTSGSRPARTIDDLPLPDAPTTATSRRSSTRAVELGDQSFAPDEQIGVLRTVRGEGAVRLASGPRRLGQLVTTSPRGDERQHLVEDGVVGGAGGRRRPRPMTPRRRPGGRSPPAPSMPPPPAGRRRAARRRPRWRGRRSHRRRRRHAGSPQLRRRSSDRARCVVPTVCSMRRSAAAAGPPTARSATRTSRMAIRAAASASASIGGSADDRRGIDVVEHEQQRGLSAPVGDRVDDAAGQRGAPAGGHPVETRRRPRTYSTEAPPVDATSRGERGGQLRTARPGRPADHSHLPGAGARDRPRVVQPGELGLPPDEAARPSATAPAAARPAGRRPARGPVRAPAARACAAPAPARARTIRRGRAAPAGRPQRVVLTAQRVVTAHQQRPRPLPPGFRRDQPFELRRPLTPPPRPTAPTRRGPRWRRGAAPRAGPARHRPLRRQRRRCTASRATSPTPRATVPERGSVGRPRGRCGPPGAALRSAPSPPSPARHRAGSRPPRWRSGRRGERAIAAGGRRETARSSPRSVAGRPATARRRWRRPTSTVRAGWPGTQAADAAGCRPRGAPGRRAPPRAGRGRAPTSGLTGPAVAALDDCISSSIRVPSWLQPGGSSTDAQVRAQALVPSPRSQHVIEPAVEAATVMGPGLDLDGR